MNPVTPKPKTFVFDLETTSGDINTAGIRQIAVIDPDEPLDSPSRVFHHFVIPQKKFRKKDADGYFAEAPERLHPRKFKKIFPKLTEWIGSKTTKGQAVKLVAHNGYSWDLPILKNNLRVVQQRYIDKREICRQANKPEQVKKYDLLQQKFILPDHWGPFDTNYLAKALRYQGSLALTDLCQLVGVPTLVAHDALNDTEMLTGLLRQMIGDAPLAEVMEAAHQNPAHPIQAARDVILSYRKTADKVNDLFMVFFDFETTGLDTDNDRVIQIGGFIPSTGAEFNEFVDPGMPIPAEATKIHHITDQMVAGKDKFDVVWRRFMTLIKRQKPNGAKLCLMGHNITGYDNKMAVSEMKRHGMYQELSVFNNSSFVDTLNLSRHVFAKQFTGVSLPAKYSHRLQTLRVAFNYAEDNAHDALGDVRVNSKVFQTFTSGLATQDVVNVIKENVYPVRPLGELIRSKGTFNAKDFVPAILDEVKRLQEEAKQEEDANRKNPHPKRERSEPNRFGFPAAEVIPTDIGVSVPQPQKRQVSSVIIDQEKRPKGKREEREGSTQLRDTRSKKKIKEEPVVQQRPQTPDTPVLYDDDDGVVPMDNKETEFEFVFKSEEF